MYCSECGSQARGKFCSNCGAALVSSSQSTVVSEPIDWNTDLRHEVLLAAPEVRAEIDRLAKASPQRISGEEYLELMGKIVSPGVPLAKLASMIQPLYAKWGIGTGKDHQQSFAVPGSWMIVRAVCSLARRGQPIREVKQAADGCVIEAALPSDLFALAGQLMVTIACHERTTEVKAATKIPGQVMDWGKSRRALETLFTDIALPSDAEIQITKTRSAA